MEKSGPWDGILAQIQHMIDEPINCCWCPSSSRTDSCHIDGSWAETSGMIFKYNDAPIAALLTVVWL